MFNKRAVPFSLGYTASSRFDAPGLLWSQKDEPRQTRVHRWLHQQTWGARSVLLTHHYASWWTHLPAWHCSSTGNVRSSTEAIGVVSWHLDSSPYPVPLVAQTHSTQIRKWVRQVPAKVQWCYFTSVWGENAADLWEEIAVVLAKNAIEPVPLAEMKKGFCRLRLILDLRVLNQALYTIEYFHVSILQRHRLFLHFAFKGQAYQYKVLPFRLFLSTRVTKVAAAALAPLREVSIHILNYLDD